MRMILKTLSKIPNGEKVLIFSMFTSCLDLLSTAIEKEFGSTFKCEQMDGDTNGKERNEILDLFAKDVNVRGLLMTYKVGSEGLNITSANHVICIEPWWTFAVPLQAEARCWRPGQTKTVNVHNIYINNTIEQRVLEICEDKRSMAKSFLESTEHSSKTSTKLDKYTLGRILGVYM